MLDTFVEKCPLPVFYSKENKIEYLRKLGEGISEVYHIKFNNKDYAGKIYINHDIDDILYETNIAEKLKHTKQSMKTQGIIFLDNDKIIILMELLISNGDLYDYISKKNRWTACYYNKKFKSFQPTPKTSYLYFNKDENIHWCYELPKKQKMKIALSISKAIDELHSVGIIHGDIKTNNMILHYQPKKQIIKLIDFGMSYFKESDKLVEIEVKTGTEGYRPPEQDNYMINEKTDIYAMGVTIIEMWNGEIWYDGQSFKESRKEVLRGLRKLEKINPELGELLRKSINLDHKKRPSSKAFLKTLKQIYFNNGHICKSGTRG
jgi:serine/threonine protein kinase